MGSSNVGAPKPGENVGSVVKDKSHHELFHQFAELSDEGVWAWDLNARITYANPRMAELLGCLAEEIIGQTVDAFIADTEVASAAESLNQVCQHENSVFNIALRRKDSAVIPAIVRIASISDMEGQLQGRLGIISDSTQRILVEKRLRQDNRSLKVLSESNQALIRAVEERELLQEICDIVVRVGGYQWAWVSYYDPYSPNSLKAVVYAGQDNTTLLETLEVLIAGNIENNGFIDVVHHRGEPFIVRDRSQNTSLLTGGLATISLNSAIALPLFDQGQVMAILGIFSREQDAFGGEEVALLTELANDLAYGILSLRDRAERKGAREALRFTQFSIDHATDPIYWVGEYGRIIDVNTAACKVMGYTQEELLNLTVYDLDPVFSKEAWNEQWSTIKEIGAITFESVHRRKDGKEIPVEITSNFLEYNKKHFSCSFVRDITERKRVVTALRESEEKFRSLVESTNDWFWEIDEHSRYSYVSPRVIDLLGYTPNEILGKQPFDFMPLGESQRIKAIFSKHAEDLEAFSCLENTLIHKDGHHIIIETSGTPIIDEKGQLKGYRGIDRDVTARRASEYELTLSLEKLRRSIEGAVEAMALTVEMKDPYTAGHQRRVAQLAWAIAKGMGLSENQLEGVRLAAMVHDIGKIYVPAEILSKPGRISEIEFSLIQTHPKVGYDVLKTIEFPWPIAQIVLQHHERLNGKGYPSGLKADEILLEAKVISVADVVEAMSSHRPYRPAVGIGQALEEIAKHSGELYDPEVVDVCLRLFEEQEFSFEELAPSG